MVENGCIQALKKVGWVWHWHNNKEGQCTVESKQIAAKSQALGPLELRAAVSLAERQQSLVGPG